jgi:phage terminase large subunit-like protein
MVTTVDTAYSTKNWADYTVIMTAVITGGRYYIVDMQRGRWNEYELPRKIAETAYRWKPKHMAIEESVGVAWLQREIRREMIKLQISVPITLASLGKGSKQKNKAAKAKPVVRLLYDERMFFSQSCMGLTEIYNELELFTGTKDDLHDDIVSGISLIVEHFGSYANDIGSPYSQQIFVGDNLSRERHEMIYGLGKYANQDDNPVTQFQIQSLPPRVEDPWGSDPLWDVYF